jgi:NitT/TauT family transport system substrate-binding protein
MTKIRAQLTALFFGTLMSVAASDVEAQSPQTIRIATVKASVLAPTLLIQKYLPAGWRTEITYFTSPSDMTNALLTDSVDLAYIGITVAVVARSKGQPIVIVSDQADKGTAIVAAANSDIKTIADLKGKRVGSLPTSIHDVLLREELKKANIALDQVILIRLAPADMPAALQRGDIDAFAGNEPNSTLAVMAGYGRVIMYPYDTPLGTINVGVLATDKIVQQKPQMMQAWAFAHAKATDELAHNPDELADIVHREWGYDLAATRRSMDNIEMKWTIDSAFRSQLAAFADRLKDLGVVQTVPDLKQLVVSDFVDRVK